MTCSDMYQWQDDHQNPVLTMCHRCLTAVSPLIMTMVTLYTLPEANVALQHLQPIRHSAFSSLASLCKPMSQQHHTTVRSCMSLVCKQGREACALRSVHRLPPQQAVAMIAERHRLNLIWCPPSSLFLSLLLFSFCYLFIFAVFLRFSCLAFFCLSSSKHGLSTIAGNKSLSDTLF